MAANMEISNSLNEQQLMMLRLFKKPLSDEDFQLVRRLAVKLLAKKLDKVTDTWEEQNEITAETYDKLSKGHFRSKS
jgi:hypothetical protein